MDFLEKWFVVIISIVVLVSIATTIWIMVLLTALVAKADTVAFDQNLYYGITNSTDVQALQEFLTVQGDYAGPITGNFFSLTLQGVEKFQGNNNLPVTGYFGVLSRGVANTILSGQILQPSDQEIGTTTASSTLPQQSFNAVGVQSTTSIVVACPVFTTPSGAIVDCNGNVLFTPTQTQTAQAQSETQQVLLGNQTNNIQAIPQAEVAVPTSCTLSAVSVTNTIVRLSWTVSDGSGVSHLKDSDYPAGIAATDAALATAPNAITVPAIWYLNLGTPTTTTYTLVTPETQCSLTVSEPTI